MICFLCYYFALYTLMGLDFGCVFVVITVFWGCLRLIWVFVSWLAARGLCLDTCLVSLSIPLGGVIDDATFAGCGMVCFVT